MSIPKIINFFACRRIFWTYYNRYTQHSNAWQRIRQVILLLTLIQSFGSQLFHFFRSGIMPTCRGPILRQRFPYILGTTSGFNITRCKKGEVRTLLKIYWPLLWLLHPQIKTYSLGRLYTLQFCSTALAVCCAATKTLILHKALKVTIHTRIITPFQTSCHANHLSGTC